MRYFETFAGVGGFTLGIERAYALQGLLSPDEREPETAGTACMGPGGLDGKPAAGLGRPVCVGLSEIDKHASAVLRYRFPNVRNYGDITKIDWASVPDFDLLVGGSPCQDMSVAGKRAGLGGERSGLFVHYVEALQVKQPSYFIWENVKGCLSSNRGRDFAAILNQMAEAGYSLWWQVLNAKDFGVPQNRERVFVVGTRTDLGSPREVFFEGGDLREDISKAVRASLEYVGSASGRDWAGDGKDLSRNAPQGSRVYDSSGIMPALAKETGGHGVVSGLALHEHRIRRLMPVECERLMSWPDDWTKYGDYGNGERVEIADTNRYKACGNGVVSDVVAAVVTAHLL